MQSSRKGCVKKIRSGVKQVVFFMGVYGVETELNVFLRPFHLMLAAVTIAPSFFVGSCVVPRKKVRPQPASMIRAFVVEDRRVSNSLRELKMSPVICSVVQIIHRRAYLIQDKKIQGIHQEFIQRRALIITFVVQMAEIYCCKAKRRC